MRARAVEVVDQFFLEQGFEGLWIGKFIALDARPGML